MNGIHFKDHFFTFEHHEIMLWCLFSISGPEGSFSFYIKDWYLNKALSESKIIIIKYMAPSFFWMSRRVCGAVVILMVKQGT